MLLDETIKELKKIMMSLTVKMRHKGEGIDSKESAFNAARYISAMDATDRFISYPYFSIDAVIAAGIASNEGDAAYYAVDSSRIPTAYRARVVEEQRKYIIKNYVEINPYYRMLNGQPALDRTKHYADLDFYDKHGIEVKPVYRFTDLEVVTLKTSGELDRIKSRYSEDIEYLDYLGDKKIDPYKARKAHNFQILRVDYGTNNTLIDNYLTIYEQNRSYVMNVLYVKAFSKTKVYYDEFMAMLINVMTAQRAIVDVFKSGISRDFFDLGLVQALLESYNVPFIEELPIEYQVLLCKNLNKLLHYKSTDKVLFDIIDLMGFNGTDIFKYYLVKNHRMDNEGNPIFEYKDDGKGNMVENVDVMYDIHYKKVNIRETNEELELSNPLNRLDYKSVAASDPLWWDDDSELLQKLYEEEFNYINTKYLGMNVMYKMTEVLFEIIHAFKILRDNKDETRSINISFDKVTPGRKIDLFTLFNFMTAALCKRRRLKGEIITSHTKVMSLVGFNFELDFAELREYLHENRDLIKSNEILAYIAKTEMSTVKEVSDMFTNIVDLWKLISNEMGRTADFKVYKIYEKLYKTLFISDYMQEVFTKSDGTIAYTYLDMLSDLDPDLFEKVMAADDDVLDSYIRYGVGLLQSIYQSSKHLTLIINDSTPLVESLLKLINFFKSYTVEMLSFNVIYVFDHPYLHGIKILDKIQRMSANSIIDDDVVLTDILKVFSQMTTEQKLFAMEKFHATSFIHILEEAFIFDKIRIESSMNVNDKDTMDMIDIVKIRSVMKNKLGLRIQELVKLSANLRRSEVINMKDRIAIDSEMTLGDQGMTLVDILQSIKTTLTYKEESLLTHWLNLVSTYTIKESKVFKDLLVVNTSINSSEKVQLIDVILYLSRIKIDTKVPMLDEITVTANLRERMDISRGDTVKIGSNINLSDDGTMIDYLKSDVKMNLRDNITFRESIRIVR